jgi:hypothetical protein
MPCDLLDTDKPGKHYTGDIKDILFEKWDLIIAHPPCTYITNSGVCHLYNKDGSKNLERWENLKEATDFFKLFLNHPCNKICIENPIPHSHALRQIGKRYSQIIQPYHFGHPEQKATCLWLKGLPRLQPTNNVYTEMMKLPIQQRQRLHYLPPSPDRWKIRSQTFSGIAEAMADQFTQPYHLQLEIFD